MGARIDMENRQDELDRRLKLLEDAFAEMIQTRVHHVDLHDEMDKHEEEIREENTVLKPDEEYTAPVGKRKASPKTTRKARTVSTT